MRVDRHRLTGEGVRQQRSPNDGGRFEAGAPDCVVLHFTAGDSVDWALDVLCDPTPGQRVSAHLLIGRDGAVTQLVDFDTVAWHAGASSWQGRQQLNRYSLGIEMDNAGRLEERGPGRFVSRLGREYGAADVVRAVHRNETTPSWWLRYPAVQLHRVEAVCRRLVDEYGLREILGHEEVAPDRKDDPGPAFPLDAMRARLLAPSTTAPTPTAPRAAASRTEKGFER